MESKIHTVTEFKPKDAPDNRILTESRLGDVVPSHCHLVGLQGSHVSRNITGMRGFSHADLSDE